MYKVTSNDLTSAFLSTYQDGITYIPNKWVSAKSHLREKGLHLLVFVSQRDAYQWADRYPTMGLRIWRCHIRGKVSILPMRRLITLNRDVGDEYEGWWPSGTVMVQKVKLIEEVTK